jgi:hypothetical protein
MLPTSIGPDDVQSAFSVFVFGLGLTIDIDVMSPPRPGTNWADWSDAMGREMYLRRALDRLNFEYPSDDTL